MSRFDKHPDMTVWQEQPFNAEPPLSLLGASPVTSLDLFYVRSHGAVPEIDASGYRLNLRGMVGRELRLSLEELRNDFSRHTVTAALQCAGNRRSGFAEAKPIAGEIPWGAGVIGNARWTGAPLTEVLEAAGVGSSARHAAFTGLDEVEHADGTVAFGGSIPLEKARASEVLLAYEMNDEPLRPVHGGPLRVVVPGYIGARSVKWLSDITLQAGSSANPFQAREYRLHPPQADERTADPARGIELGELSINAAILEPADGAMLEPGPVTVSGYAMAGGPRSVERVDLSLDDGRTWRYTELSEDHGLWAWRGWSAQVELTPGEHVIAARAWESSANTQPEHSAAIWNYQGYANNAWPRVTVRVDG